MTATTTGGRAAPVGIGRLAAWAGWALVALLAVGFIGKYVIHYLARFGAKELADFWPRRYGFVPHIVFGSGALILGLAQFWTGLRRMAPTATAGSGGPTSSA